MRGLRLAFVGVAVGLLSACAPPPLEVISDGPDFESGITVNPVAAPPLATVDPIETAVIDADSNEPVIVENEFDQVDDTGVLIERLPNTCRLQNYQQFVGQDAAVLAGAGLDRAWRVVGPNAIVTQEYNPARLNFRTNASGVIQRIICG